MGCGLSEKERQEIINSSAQRCGRMIMSTEGVDPVTKAIINHKICPIDIINGNNIVCPSPNGAINFTDAWYKNHQIPGVKDSERGYSYIPIAIVIDGGESASFECFIDHKFKVVHVIHSRTGTVVGSDFK